MSIDPARRARQISTIHEHDICDICGRTLLRGERTEPFLDGSRHYDVCELCKPHALHEGWLRAGALPEYQSTSSSAARRSSLFGRLRRRSRDDLRDGSGGEIELTAPQSLDDELMIGGWGAPAAPAPDENGYDASVPAPRARPQRRSTVRPHPERADRPREPRHVRAVPTEADHRAAAAVDAFNRSAHTRTVAGVARSLGAPQVSIVADLDRATVVWVVTTWELCWYRYEVDLADDGENVRLDAQGYELDELAAHERVANGSADEAGRVVIL